MQQQSYTEENVNWTTPRASAGHRQKWMLTRHAFDGLLARLGPDRDTAAEKYLEIRRNLVRFFEWRGCATPDEYADETINRCAKRIADGEEIRDPATYFIGIARMLAREMGRERAREVRISDDLPESPTAPAEVEHDMERRAGCLRRCLEDLSPEDRDLILCYYEGDKGEKIKNRKKLIDLLGVPPSTLRMRALRIRERLFSSVEACLQKQTRVLSCDKSSQPATTI